MDDASRLVHDTYVQIRDSMQKRWPTVNELPRNPENPAAEYGFVLPNLATSLCVVRVGRTPDGTVRLNLWAPAALGIEPTAGLYQTVGRESVHWAFGCLGVFPTPAPDRYDLAFDYSIPTAALTPALLDRLIRGLVIAASDMGSRLRGQPDEKLPGVALASPQPTKDQAYRQVGEWLVATWPKTHADPQIWAYHVHLAESGDPAVTLNETSDGTVRLVVSSIVARDVRPGPELYKRIGHVATDFLFGTIGVYPDEQPEKYNVAFHYAIPAAALSPNVVHHLVRMTMSSAADVARAWLLG